MGLGPNYIIATIFGLKNKLEGGVAKMGKKRQNRPKNVFFFALRPRNRKTSFLLKEKKMLLGY